MRVVNGGDGTLRTTARFNKVLRDWPGLPGHGLLVVLTVFVGVGSLVADEPELQDRTIGYTELRTNLEGGRHANVRTMRAALIQGDGTGYRRLAEGLADGPDAWTQLAGWSPDGRKAVVLRGWQDPGNAKWEQEHRQFRMTPGQWQLDASLVQPESGERIDVTSTDRVSHYNSVTFSADGKHLLMTSLIDGISRPFVMELDGSNKRDVSGESDGFTYGYSASPNGKWISYHSNYQVYVAAADGSQRRHIETGNPFNFAPRWSADGEWLLFVSGEHGRSHPYLVKRDGTGLRKLADLNGYQGWILFLDVDDFHQGSSDLPVWSADGKSVFYTARVGENVELFQVTLDGELTQLTESASGTLHYHPTPSADGRGLLYGAKRHGIRQLFVRDLKEDREIQITHLQPGHAAMWPHWRPAADSLETSAP